MARNILLMTIVVSIIIGLGTGFLLGQQYTRSGVLNPIEELQASWTIRSVHVLASGTVVEIGDRTITIEQRDDTRTIPLKAQAPVARLLPPEPTGSPKDVPFPKRELILFEDIQMGDVVNIFAEVKLDGSLEGVGVDVIVFP